MPNAANAIQSQPAVHQGMAGDREREEDGRGHLVNLKLSNIQPVFKQSQQFEKKI